MAKKHQNKTIIALVDDDSWKEIENQIGDEQEFKLLRGLNPVENGIKSIKKQMGDLIILDASFGEQIVLRLIDDLVNQYPEIPIVAVLEGTQIDLVQSVTLAGARSFILKPFTKTNISETINRVIELQSRLSPAKYSNAESKLISNLGNQTIAVYSPRGGVGCTTISSNLALAIMEKTGEKVLLIDGKSYFGHLDVVFNLQTSNTIADLIPHAEELDARLINNVVVKHASGLHILKGPNRFSATQDIKPESIYNILVSLQQEFPFIIIDTGSSLDENTVTFLDFAKKIIIPVNPDMSSLRDGREFSNIAFSMLAYPKSKMLFAINNADIKGGINPQYLLDALAVDPVIKIPTAPSTVLRSINRGVPVIMKDKKHAFSKAIYELTDNLIEILTSENAPISADVKSSTATNDILAQSSRLG